MANKMANKQPQKRKVSLVLAAALLGGIDD